MNQKISPSECKVCGAQLAGKNVVRIGDQAFCSPTSFLMTITFAFAREAVLPEPAAFTNSLLVTLMILTEPAGILMKQLRPRDQAGRSDSTRRGHPACGRRTDHCVRPST